MTRSITIHFASVALGLVLAVVCALGMSQSSPSGDAWPPKKTNIVNVFEYPTTPITIPPGGSYTVYKVPANQWLTLTGASGSSGGTLQLAENHGGTIQPKGVLGPNALTGSGGPVGWTFHPGSNVIIQNIYQSTSVDVYLYALIGYLSRE